MTEQPRPVRPTVTLVEPSDSSVPRQPSPLNTVPYPTQADTTNKSYTFHLPGRKSNSPMTSRPPSPLRPFSNYDLERQPLLATTGEDWGKRVLSPLIVGVFMAVIIIVALGYGGLMIGKGEGEHRWPGGPHNND